MFFDRFDIVQAHRMFYRDYHEGQYSDSYRKLCRIDEYYQPSLSESWYNYEDLNDNAKYIYDALVERHGYERE